ncbi:rhodanese-like domain-containing protein [Lacticaseibacillus pabuli]|uniref:Rhodanese-like domain-containing protein n=1 Tax=Lacticaseibacillus pabuli TaxID=3025672 RepID=A0ABY7WVY9_9LACO|nr:rhodanese-like domain-containing protein [Lacticaseibacillus sp. KACC 23028]WDF82090.1 rhodanese-like domain-containing protein [Lacticaseibacillus sp. KACC 23028]
MNSITTNELAKLLAVQPITLLDVREPDEYAAGHIAEAQLLPLGNLPQMVGNLSKQSQLYVICRSGRRSQMAVDFLTDQGYTAVNVTGGMNAWTGEVESTD